MRTSKQKKIIILQHYKAASFLLMGVAFVMFLMHASKSLQAIYASTDSDRDFNLGEGAPQVSDILTKDVSFTMDTTTSSSTASRRSLIDYSEYQPGPFEKFLLDNTEKLGFNMPPDKKWVKVCKFWKEPDSSPFYDKLFALRNELANYYEIIHKFRLADGITDLRRNMTEHDNQVCDKLKLHPDGLPGLFNESGQLSFTRSGWVEPLMPPMRHPNFCIGKGGKLLNVKYIVHDFHAICQRLKPTSRTVFIDMGASFSFHGKAQSPVLPLIDQFQKFGIKFDHIYGYEMRPIPASLVVEQIPPHLQSAYHWINVGVSSDLTSKQNPFKMLLESFDEDDFIVVKLDIDTAWLERELVDQILATPRLQNLIDVFYFEHHVNMEELRSKWRRSGGGVKESVGDSFRTFSKLRQQGVAAHFWV